MPKASMSVATLALVVAATGGVAAYAGTQIGTAEIKNNAVTSPKIKNGQVSAADLSPKARTRSWVWHPAGAIQKTWPASGVINLGNKTIKVTTAGLLELNTFAIRAGGDTEFDLVLALVDYKGNLATALDGTNPAATAKVYDAIGAAMSITSGVQQLSIPQRVGAGKHKITYVAVNQSAVGGETTKFALRVLTAEFQPGVSGKESPWTLPPAAPRQLARQLFR